jgi:flagellar hook-associated protein 3 FlgL
MRITNNIVLRNSLAGLQANSSAVQKLQVQLSTGLKIQTASDDPTAASEVMTSSGSLLAVEQYKRNISNAQARGATEGSTLDRLTELLARAREITVGQATATANATTRQTAAAEMGQLFDSAINLSSSKFGNEYLFGGETVTQQPFASTGSGATLDYTTTTPIGTRPTAISAGQSLTATHDGQQVFETSGVLTALRDAVRGLASGNQTSVAHSLTDLDTAFNNVQVLIGENGARMNALDITTQNLDALKSNLTTYRSSLQDIDVEAAVTALVTKQTAYQAAMMATSKVLGMTLADYLR